MLRLLEQAFDEGDKATSLAIRHTSTSSTSQQTLHTNGARAQDIIYCTKKDLHLNDPAAKYASE